MSTLVSICPCILIHPIHFGPFGPIRSTLFPFGPIFSVWSTSFHLVQFGPFMPHFGPFLCTYIYREKNVWVESTYSESKFIKKIYINLKFIIFKILSIVFIIATLLLSHIKITFQFTSVQLNFSEKVFLNMKVMNIQIKSLGRLIIFFKIITFI